MRRILLPAVLLLAVAAPAPAHTPDTTAQSAQALFPSFPDPLPAARRAEPESKPTPRAQCGPGSKPEPSIQGRLPKEAVDSGAAKDGYWCNLTRVGHYGNAGGYKVRRYVDPSGRECAYYDTTLLFPLNALNVATQQPTGVAVLDMSNPANPVLTETLVTPAMETPHESVVLNPRRGLLAAVTGNPALAPGFVDLYDLSSDCRHPVLKSTLQLGFLGHESGFAEDGNTLYAATLGYGTITAIDVSNPAAPKTLVTAPIESHGLTLSKDGNRAYVAGNGGLLILDVSDIQARKPNPQMRQISKLGWSNVTIPQVAYAVTIKGKPYIVEIDEFSKTADGGYTIHGDRVGAGRIIDISDEKAPRVVSNLRLEVNQPENRAAIANDPNAQNPVGGYAGHYCDIPRRDDPEIVACSFIASGLRVFDIRDPEKPREIAYHYAPPSPTPLTGDLANYAMSAGAFVPERREIWYSDGNSGFYALRLAEGLWPAADKTSACSALPAIKSVAARGLTDGGVFLGLVRREQRPVQVDVFQVSDGRRVVKERLAKRFRNRTGSFTWDGRGARDGTYFVRFRMFDGTRMVDTRRVVLRRANGRFARQADYHRRDSCDVLTRFKLERPVFGGSTAVPLRASFFLAKPATVAVEVRRGTRVVKRYAATSRQPGRTVRLTLAARGLRAGEYAVRITVRSASGATQTATLRARRL
jgi:hypothetical protein